LLERGKGKRDSRVAASVVSRIRKKDLQKQIREKVKLGSALYTDAFWSYKGLEKVYQHQVVDHARSYVEGKVHTNGLENFWSLLKRTIKGTYVSVDPFHVAAYLDEQVHRFNNRGLNDRGRFVDVVRSIVDRRLTYRDLTGADLSLATT
jgi:transposase-like protein